VAEPPPIALLAVSDRGRIPGGDLAAWARANAEAGVDLLQVRERDLADGALLEAVRVVVEAVRGTSTAVMVNGRADLATAAGAHGVQLPEEGLPVAHVRRAFPRLRIGASCHSVAACVRAQEDGADLVLLGPVLATPGKESRALGLAIVREACRAVRMPLFVIGGVTPGNAGALVAAGARGLAAIRAFLDPRPTDAVRRFREAVAGARV
jgi:thiamine-phosphate diphosphorylase